MNPKSLIVTALLAVSGAALAADGFSPLDRAGAARLTDPGSQRVPTVVALWSQECVHCKKNLAHFAALARADARVKIVTVAVEPADPALAVPLDRLAVPGARYAYGMDTSPEALAFALDPKWRGELPRTLFFDGRGGKRAVSGIVSEAAAREALGLTN